MDSPIDKIRIKLGTTDKELGANPVRVNNSPLRIGVAGAGLMGQWHARAAAKTGGSIVGFADIDKNRAALLAAKYPAAQIFSDLTEMIAENYLDVLHICTPTADHKAAAEHAIDAGVNLFIEKPLASSSGETVYLYDLAWENKVSICPAHQFAFQQSVKEAVTLLPRIGQVIHLQAVICSAGGVGLADGQIDSIAIDILPHPLSLFQIFLNDVLPEENWEVFHPLNGEFRIYGQSSKISLSIFISMNARPTTNSFQIIGTNGTIHLDLFHDFAVLETGKVSRRRKILHPFDLALKNFSAAAFNLMRRTARRETAYPGLQNLVNRFYQSIRGEGEAPITSKQAINVACVRDYLINAAGTNKLSNDLKTLNE